MFFFIGKVHERYVTRLRKKLQFEERKQSNQRRVMILLVIYVMNVLVGGENIKVQVNEHCFFSNDKLLILLVEVESD